VGCGAAWAMLFVTITTSKFRADDSTENRLLLVSLSIIAGFLGYRLLQGLASKLEKQVQEIDFKTEENQKRTAALEELVAAIGVGLRALEEGVPPAQVLDAVRILNETRSKLPMNRSAAIILARLQHEALGDTERGVAVLTDAIEAKRREGSDRDKDAADLRYNRACYCSVLAGKDASNRARHVAQALDDLAISCELSPDNKREAQADKDFDVIRGETRFVQIVS
jgi:hypothetical protein